MWGARKAIEDSFVAQVDEATATTSGTLFIENDGGTFYLSHTGYGQANALATFDTSDWTNCTEVFVSIFGWSGNQVLDGTGSYFDNFSLAVAV